MTRRPPRSFENIDPSTPAAFVTSLRPACTLNVTLDNGTMTRLRASMERVERDEPGLAFAPGETFAESLEVSVLSNLDRGLTGGEADDGVAFDFLTGKLKPRRTEPFRVRAKRAWRILRRG